MSMIYLIAIVLYRAVVGAFNYIGMEANYSRGYSSRDFKRRPAGRPYVHPTRVYHLYDRQRLLFYYILDCYVTTHISEKGE